MDRNLRQKRPLYKSDWIHYWNKHLQLIHDLNPPNIDYLKSLQISTDLFIPIYQEAVVRKVAFFASLVSLDVYIFDEKYKNF